MPSGASNCLELAARLGIAPGALVAQNGVEEDEEFSGDRRERQLGRLARRAQALIEGPEHRVVPRRDQGRHVEHGAHRRPAAPAGPPPPEGATIAGERGDAHQGRDRVAIEVPQFAGSLAIVAYSLAAQKVVGFAGSTLMPL